MARVILGLRRDGDGARLEYRNLPGVTRAVRSKERERIAIGAREQTGHGIFGRGFARPLRGFLLHGPTLGIMRGTSTALARQETPPSRLFRPISPLRVS
jgi:transglutaminase-like putative cysteine protease